MIPAVLHGLEHFLILEFPGRAFRSDIRSKRSDEGLAPFANGTVGKVVGCPIGHPSG